MSSTRFTSWDDVPQKLVRLYEQAAIKAARAARRSRNTALKHGAPPELVTRHAAAAIATSWKCSGLDRSDFPAPVTHIEETEVQRPS